ncbi:hypothetical protein [Actinophytocola sediminis]
MNEHAKNTVDNTDALDTEAVENETVARVVGSELVMRRVAPVATPVPDRATRVASWLGWHLPEITGVAVPAAVAVSVSPWLWLVSAAVGAGWSVQAVRTAREQAAIRAGSTTAAGTDTASGERDSVPESGVDGTARVKGDH